ncbi:hypothetical protein [Streptomyces sp. NPDC058463]|uniref:hypothetical protein n=1 Tax=Streptomyces sp. NPDC058463 TaxID=3346510 RepID=UPI0036582BF7
MTTGLQRITPLTVLLALLLMTGACGSPQPAPPVEPATREPADSDPASPLPSAVPSSAAGSEVVGRAPADLRDVDWAAIPFPGEFCAVPGLVRFDAELEARARSETWGPVRIRRTTRVVYGNFDGDTRDEAIVYVGCDDDGVTQNTQIAAGYVVFGHAGRNLVVLGSITPQQKSRASYPTALVRPEFAEGRITVYEKWYRTSDAHCCPTGDATTVWTREGNRLTPGAPRIVS